MGIGDEVMQIPEKVKTCRYILLKDIGMHRLVDRDVVLTRDPGPDEVGVRFCHQRAKLMRATTKFTPDESVIYDDGAEWMSNISEEQPFAAEQPRERFSQRHFWFERFEGVLQI